MFIDMMKRNTIDYSINNSASNNTSAATSTTIKNVSAASPQKVNTPINA